MNEYICVPEKNQKGTVILCVALLILAALLFGLSMAFSVIRLWGQILAVALLLVFVQITNKYLLSGQKYTWKDGRLIFSAKTGEKERVLGGISVTTDCYLYTKDKWEKHKRNHRITRKFSYRQNLFGGEEYILLLPERRDFVMVSFEPDEVLAAAIREKIDEIQN